jgi:thiamine-phosphate pyrophosphorylase
LTRTRTQDATSHERRRDSHFQLYLVTDRLYDIAVTLRQLCTEYGARLLINDRVDIAVAVDADGVHLPADSFKVDDVRALLGPEKLIGVSAHSVRECKEAGKAGADFVVLGPIFATPSKRIYGEPLGTDAIKEAAAGTDIPVLAIGGITAERAGRVRNQGAAGVAVISGILQATDPEAAAREYLRRLQS